MGHPILVSAFVVHWVAPPWVCFFKFVRGRGLGILLQVYPSEEVWAIVAQLHRMDSFLRLRSGQALPLVVRMTANGELWRSLKHESPPGTRRAFSLYIQFSNLGGNSTPNWLGFFLFGMCGLEDFFCWRGLTTVWWDSPAESTGSGQVVGYPHLRPRPPADQCFFD
jgi:hypothetical protein